MPAHLTWQESSFVKAVLKLKSILNTLHFKQETEKCAYLLQDKLRQIFHNTCNRLTTLSRKRKKENTGASFKKWHSDD